ncbi:hypothetical protein [Natronobiforma cellulositropha]|uniref:hypothetical protein n=1 Tax=Natronobiforma cellulositropha TaxID=1679076 RepID=UPI0021D5A5AB|nr:hypothetical protein [Natronobiforma cellulositropha]
MRLPRPRTRDGRPVDPVPLLVVVLTLFLLTHAWGPLYLGALGFSLPAALAIATAVFCCLSVVAYHRLVWRGGRERDPYSSDPLSWLLYAVAIAVALAVLLALPFLR